MQHIDIRTHVDIEGFMRKVSNFHDGIVKEAHLSERASVEKDLSMKCDFNIDFAMIVQKQGIGPNVVEVVFKNVVEIVFQRSSIISEATFQLDDDKNGEKRFSFIFDYGTIRSRQVMYRFVDGWLGKELRYRSS